MEVEEINVSVDTFSRICRFCLMLKNDGQVLTVEELEANRIPLLYKTLLDTELVVLLGYPIMFCETCIKELEAAVEIRDHFKKINQFWKNFLCEPNKSVDNNFHFIEIENEIENKNEEDEVESGPNDFIESENNENLSTKSEPIDGVDFIESEDNEKLSIKSEPIDVGVGSTVEQTEQNIIVTSKPLVTLKKYDRRRLPKLNTQKKTQKRVNHAYRKCYKCNQKFRSVAPLVKHLYKHINKKCDICNVQLPTFSLWYSHLKEHYPEEYNTHKKSKKIKRYVTYLDRIPNSNYMMCNHCGLKRADLGKMFHHHRMQHQKLTKIECYVCKESFTRMHLLKRHIGIVHQQDGEPAPDDVFCHICGVTIKCGNFKRHMLTTHADGKIGRMIRLPDSVLESVKCSYCSESYKLKTRLHRHVEENHPDEFPKYKKLIRLHKVKTRKNYVWVGSRRCGVCCSTFDNPTDYSIHLETHNNYECEICKKKFIGKQNFERHAKQHSKKDRPFICEVCNASFTREPHVKSHVRRLHTTDRPFPCEKCDKAFAARYEMLAHLRIVHLEMKTHKCSYCDAAFSTLQSKKLHETKHTGKALYECKICHKPFLLMKALEMHIGRYHEKEA